MLLSIMISFLLFYAFQAQFCTFHFIMHYFVLRDIHCKTSYWHVIHRCLTVVRAFCKILNNFLTNIHIFLRMFKQVAQFIIQVEMSLSILSTRNLWYKNGIWWFTKIANRLIGETNYDTLRVQRRILSNKFYYIRQQILYRTYIESPDVANMIGIYPKTDSSHGYGNPLSYEMYRDFQQNSINSDGSFSTWIAYISLLYIGHTVYNYFLPWYWNKTASCKNGEAQRARIRDVLASTNLEESIGYQFLEWGFGPHYTYYLKEKLLEGHSHPDDVRAMACSGLNRKNRYVEHYKKESRRMISFM